MSSSIVRRGIRWLSLGLLGGGLGCQQAPPPVAATTPPQALVTVVAPEIDLSYKPRDIDASWIELDDFFPLGATRIVPPRAPPVRLVPTPRQRYPSTEDCLSPSRQYALFSQGGQTAGTIFHWLMLRSAGLDSPVSLFQTTHTFEVLWAPHSAAFAVTELTGDNRSEVSCLQVATLQNSGPIDLTSVLSQHFSAYQLEGARFSKAFRWTDTGDLVVRGVGREPSAPFNFFGYEVLLNFDGSGGIRMTFLRGYWASNAIGLQTVRKAARRELPRREHAAGG